MPKVTPIIVEQEAGTAFEAQIAVAVNRLVGNYGVTKHAACAMLQHCHLNRVFELADMSYQSCLEPVACAVKRRRATTMTVQLRCRKR
jgi:hypothetical protein